MSCEQFRPICTRNLLHQAPFRSDTFYKQLLHQTPANTKQPSHQAFTEGILYARHLLDQGTFYTKATFTPKHLLHQPPFAPDTFYTFPGVFSTRISSGHVNFRTSHPFPRAGRSKEHHISIFMSLSPLGSFSPNMFSLVALSSIIRCTKWHKHSGLFCQQCSGWTQ